LAKHNEINKIVNDYKSGVITHSECVRYIETTFRPLFFKKKKEMAPINTDHTWIGSFWDVYLQSIVDSLKNFSKDMHNGRGENQLSFVPYFQALFNNRCIDYKKVLSKEIKEAEKVTSLEKLLEQNSVGLPKFQFSISKNVDIFDHIQHHDDSFKNEVEFEKHIKSFLTKTEYKIFYMKMCGRSNAYIGTKMKAYRSGEYIRKEWDKISSKIFEHVTKRKNDLC
jgi:hypothetical protein